MFKISKVISNTPIYIFMNSILLNMRHVGENTFEHCLESVQLGYNHIVLYNNQKDLQFN